MTQQVYELRELATELERQQETKWDIITEPQEVRFVDYCDVTGEDDGLRLYVAQSPSNQYMPLTNWAHNQVSNKLGIPWNYYQRMMEEGEYALLADNANTWLHRGEKPRMFRTLDGQVRAFLSDQFYYVENQDILDLTLSRLQAKNMAVHQCALTEKSMYIKATVPYLETEILKDDRVVPGIVIQNSEVGAGRLSIMPFMLRKICSNGLIGTHGFSRIHLGARKGTGIVKWSDETRKAETSLIKNQIIDAIEQIFDPEIIREWGDHARRGADFKIEDRIVACEAIRLNLGISKAERDDLINYFAEEPATQWGLVNGVTRMAREQKDYERQVELEQKVAYNLFQTPETTMNKWLEQAKKEVLK